jgi:hypothetical protein
MACAQLFLLKDEMKIWTDRIPFDTARGHIPNGALNLICLMSDHNQESFWRQFEGRPDYVADQRTASHFMKHLCPARFHPRSQARRQNHNVCHNNPIPPLIYPKSRSN